MTFDWAVLHWIQANLRCGVLDFLMPVFSLLDTGGTIWLIAAAILLCTKKYRKQGVLLLAGLLCGLIFGNGLLKNLVQRSRPCWLDDSVQLLITLPKDYSFPSGHTLSSVIAAVILTCTDRRFGFAAIPLAVLISFSRLYLYVHFPTDVLGSLLLGLIIGFAVWCIGSRVQLPKSSGRNE